MIGCVGLESMTVVWKPPMAPPEKIGDTLVKRPNPVCMDEIGEAECGYCRYTISDKVIYVGEQPEHQFNSKPWSKLKKHAILFPAEESYAPMKAFGINACKSMGSCNKDIAKWRIKLDSFDSIGSAVSSP